MMTAVSGRSKRSMVPLVLFKIRYLVATPFAFGISLGRMTEAGFAKTPARSLKCTDAIGRYSVTMIYIPTAGGFGKACAASVARLPNCMMSGHFFARLFA